MGVGLSAPIVYEEPTKTRYRANSMGAWLVEIIGLLTVLIVPFIIAYSMGQFWLEYNVFVESPDVTFGEKCLMKAETFKGETMLYGCSDSVALMLAGDARRVTPLFSVLRDHRDGDTKVDAYEFNIQFPLDDPTDSVARFEFLPAFQYKVSNDILNVEMETATYIAATSGTNMRSNSLTIDGFLKFNQLQPLHSSDYVRYDRAYDFSLFDKHVVDKYSLTDIAGLAAKYAKRNESAIFTQNIAAFNNKVVTDVDDANTFSITITMRVAPATIEYIPSSSEFMKHAWVQYFAIAYVIHWAFGLIRALVVKQAWVNTIALYQDAKTLWRTGGR